MEDFRLCYFFRLTAFLSGDPGRNAGMRTALYSIGFFVLKLRPVPPLWTRL